MTGPVLLDGTIARWLSPGGHDSVGHRLAQLVIDVFSPVNQIVAGALLAAVVLALSRSVLWAAICLIGPAAADAAAFALKQLVGRTRPGDMGEALFPSGHTTAISARAAVVVLLACAATSSPATRRAWGATAALLALTLGISVVALRDHYATDSLAGLLLGPSLTVLLASAAVAGLTR